MKQYIRQNKIQRSVQPIVEKFFPNKTLSGFYHLETYSPRLNKLKLTAFVIGAVACVVTPFTNWLVIPLTGWALK